mmetsp:Transcript_104746/g.233814  ORF Transcript_104746/g.233814 Transcript_104746/m.233814 type:complete len:241 (+) Transcript_104746:1079-1801(+)
MHRRAAPADSGLGRGSPETGTLLPGLRSRGPSQNEVVRSGGGLSDTLAEVVNDVPVQAGDGKGKAEKRDPGTMAHVAIEMPLADVGAAKACAMGCDTCTQSAPVDGPEEDTEHIERADKTGDMIGDPPSLRAESAGDAGTHWQLLPTPSIGTGGKTPANGDSGGCGASSEEGITEGALTTSLLYTFKSAITSAPCAAVSPWSPSPRLGFSSAWASAAAATESLTSLGHCDTRHLPENVCA